MLDKIFKYFKSGFNIIIIITSLILVILSTTILIIIQYNFSKNNLDFSIDGLNYYLSEFTTYKELFITTITLIVAYFGILRLTAAEEANKEKLKQDRFGEWKYLLDIRITEVEKNNPFLKRQFTTIRFKLFESLYKKNMEINSQNNLYQIFDKELRDSIKFLEEMNENYQQKGVYPNCQYSYIYSDFQFIFLGLLDNYYNGMEGDLKNVVANCLDPNRTIDEKLYASTFR
jgi:hypothetical protein